MKRGSLFAILLLSACGILLIWAMGAIIALTIIKYWGEKVTVSVVEVPVNCGKYNRIKILYKENISEVKISKTECRRNVFKVGQQLTLLKHPAFDEFVWPDSQPEIVLILMIALLVFLYFDTRKKIRAHAHRTSNYRKPKT